VRAILFDYGGVLSPGGTVDSHANYLARRLGVPLPARRVANLHRAFRVGAISTAEFVDGLHALVPGRRHDLDVNDWDWPEVLRRDLGVYAAARRLRASGIRTGILSNVWPPIAGRLASSGAYDDFDPVVLSCEVGNAKPHPAIYLAALERLACEPSSVLLVDDQERCLDAARSLGMQTLKCTDGKQLVVDLAAVQAEDDPGIRAGTEER
jgi:FMN phosphatase YigB (HAD superfamily)